MTKQQLRVLWLQIRQEIPFHRKQEAKVNFLQFIKASKLDGLVLSYASFNDELDTSNINEYLADQGKLILPRIEKGSLKTYLVNDLKNQLIQNSFGINEPDPVLCLEINPNKIATILVPGLVFDNRNARIGYSKGYYDRFLSLLAHEHLTYGLGFKEQLSIYPLPIEKHDVSLDHLILL